MHINYCEQGQEIEEICQKAVDWGFDGVEFRRRRVGVEETSEDYLDRLESGIQAAGLEHVLFGFPGPLLLNPDADIRKREVDAAVAFYRSVAARFGVTTINLLTGQLQNPDPSISYFDCTKHGSFIASDDQWEWHVEGCRAMADCLSDVDIKFGIETHMVYLHDTAESVRKLIDRIDRPAIGATLDYGNIVNFTDPPSLDETIELLNDSIFYVHLKNSVPVGEGMNRMPTALGEGEINNRLFLALLKKIGYKGPICIEAPRSGDREWYAQQDIAYLKSVLSDLGM